MKFGDRGGAQEMTKIYSAAHETCVMGSTRSSMLPRMPLEGTRGLGENLGTDVCGLTRSLHILLHEMLQPSVS